MKVKESKFVKIASGVISVALLATIGFGIHSITSHEPKPYNSITESEFENTANLYGTNIRDMNMQDTRDDRNMVHPVFYYEVTNACYNAMAESDIADNFIDEYCYSLDNDTFMWKDSVNEYHSIPVNVNSAISTKEFVELPIDCENDDVTYSLLYSKRKSTVEASTTKEGIDLVIDYSYKIYPGG